MFHYLFGFGGRINRAKMWLLLVVQFVWMAFAFATRPLVGKLIAACLPNPAAIRLGTLVYVVVPFLFVFVAVFVKRLHDRNKSWWWFLVLFVLPMALIPLGYQLSGYAFTGFAPDMPEWTVVSETRWTPVGFGLLGVGLLGYAWYFVELFCLRGTRGENRFGPDPLMD